MVVHPTPINPRRRHCFGILGPYFFGAEAISAQLLVGGSEASPAAFLAPSQRRILVWPRFVGTPFCFFHQIASKGTKKPFVLPHFTMVLCLSLVGLLQICASSVLFRGAPFFGGLKETPKGTPLSLFGRGGHPDHPSTSFRRTRGPTPRGSC